MILRFSRRHRIAAAGILVALVACRRYRSADPRILYDPQLVDRTAGILRNHFHGAPSTIVLGIGWYGLEHAEATGPWSGFAWAAGSATVYFGRPTGTDVELAAVCAPFSYPGSPTQTLTPVLNGQVLPEVRLSVGFQEVRVKLPSADFRPLNALELRFAYEKQASAVVPGSIDERFLSALFSDLAIGPPGSPMVEETSSFQSAGDHTRIALGVHGVALPLPRGLRFRLRTGDVTSSDPAKPVELALWERGTIRRPFWSGAASRLENRTISFATPSLDPAMLVLRPLPASGARAPVTVSLSGLDVAEGEPSSTPPRPDIFIYLVDTLRADELGVYGSKLPLTPRMDAFARDAVTYERARSVSSWTLPATISLLSGLYPFSHGVMQMGQSIPETGLVWMPEELRRLGYETAGFSQWLLGKTPGIERGFDSFALNLQRSAASYLKTPSEILRGLIFQFLRDRHADPRPLFAYIHVTDPHANYEPQGEDRIFADRQPGTLPPELYAPQIFLARDLGGNPADRAHLKALYDGEVHHADREFGAFLDLLRYLGLYDESLIILVSDHGEEFYEHGGFDHSRTLYEELLRIPFIVKFPRQRWAGARVPQTVSLLDVAPTIFQLLGHPYGNLQLHGKPLPQPGQASSDSRSLFSELVVDRSGKENAMDLAATLVGDVKCISNASGLDRFGRPAPHYEAFDLRKDPGESDRLADYDPHASGCQDDLSHWIGRAREAAARAHRPIRPLPPEEVRRLRALGYIN